MVKVGCECQLQSTCRHTVTFQLRGSVVPIKFLLVSVNMLSAEHETYNALVVVWENRGRCVSRNLARHCLSAHS